MKKLILTLLVLFSLNSFAGIIIVSDLDDTIKITNSGKEIDGTINAVFTKNVFILMPEFLKAAGEYSNELHVVSASPSILKHKIEETFKKYEIKVDSLSLKNPLIRSTKIEYKAAVIKKLMDNTTDDFIFLGDDIGQDPEVYDEMMRHYPDRVIASYIHVVQDRKIPNSQTPYWTTYDLFLREYLAGRMQKSQVKMAAEKLLTDVNMKFVIPGFADCPKTPMVWMWQLPTIFFSESREISKKMNRYCLSSHSVILADQ